MSTACVSLLSLKRSETTKPNASTASTPNPMMSSTAFTTLGLLHALRNQAGEVQDLPHDEDRE